MAKASIKKVFKDQIGESVEISFPPKRIISIVPSQTELLYDLALEMEVIGITKFCIHPNEWFRSKKRIGGTKNLKIDQILELKPDLILANKEENDKTQVEKLKESIPVWTSDVKTIKDALEMISSVGGLVNKIDLASKIKNEIETGFEIFQNDTKKKCAYVIWKDPLMVVGGDTFINSMLEKAGFENVFKNQNRYPTTSIEEILSLNIDALLLSSEPFPFKEKHIQEFEEQLPSKAIKVVDGEIFSWYGSRMKKATTYFSELSKAF